MYEYERDNNDNSNQVNPETRYTDEQIKLIKQAEKSVKRGKFFKKFFAAVGLGLAFGVLAGVGFYGSNAILNKIKSNVTVTEHISEAVPDNKESGNDAKKDEKDVKDNTDAAKDEKDDGKEKENRVVQSIPNTEVIDSNADEGMENAVSTGGMDVSLIVKNSMPSIVSITNKSIQEVRSMFGGGVQQYESQSAGSGIIIGQDDEEILIVTNNHVVEGANALTVGFIDEEVYSATVKGMDPDLDLAVIAVDINDLKDSTLGQIKVAVVGKSSDLLVGQQVIAIGNAMGYGQSVTTGIVSALEKDHTNDNVDNPLLQTDAAINPGNSGGALLNARGELVGINCAKIASTYIEGVGYAIPIDYAVPVIETLMNRETREKVDAHEAGYLGITGVTVDSNTSQIYNVPMGVYIQSVEKGSPADEAGIIQTDVIRKFDGITVSTINEIRNNLDYYKAGEVIDLEIYRIVDGEYVEKTVSITLGSREGTAIDPDAVEENENSDSENKQDENPGNDGNTTGYFDPFSIFGY